MNSRPVSAIVLAAGGSTRLGKPKQLVAWQNTTLLGYVLDQIRDSSITETILVLGSYKDLIKSSIRTRELRIAVNPDWKRGIGSSIRTGIEAVQNKISDVMIFVSDQPYLTTELIESLIQKRNESGALICAPVVEEITCNPVIFDKSLRPELSKLRNNQGGKSLFKDYKNSMEQIAWKDPRILKDIDTIQDLDNLIL